MSREKKLRKRVVEQNNFSMFDLDKTPSRIIQTVRIMKPYVPLRRVIA